MNIFQVLIKAASIQTLWLGVASVIAGTAAAAVHGNTEVYPALACLLFVVFAQCTSNIIHRYYDAKHGYGENEEDNIGYCEDIGRPAEYVLKEGIRVFSILSATAGLAVLSMSGWWTLIFAALIAFFAVVNNLGPYPLSRSVFYPVATFFIFGPVAVIGTELVQSQDTSEIILSWTDLKPAVIMSFITGLMAVNCHVIYGAFHRRKNAVTLRTTFYGRYGRTGATILVVTTTLLYGAAGVMAPWMMDMLDGYRYLPVPLLSMALSFVTVYFARHPRYIRLAWRLSLVNMVSMALSSLIVFSIIGTSVIYLGN